MIGRLGRRSRHCGESTQVDPDQHDGASDDEANADRLVEQDDVAESVTKGINTNWQAARDAGQWLRT